MLIESDRFLKLVSWFQKPAAITLWPFIIVSPTRIAETAKARGKTLEKYKTELINHESIHLRQQRELWVIPFYIMYAYYFLKNLVIHKQVKYAYLKIPFEVEAFQKETELAYLETRPKKNWKNLV